MAHTLPEGTWNTKQYTLNQVTHNAWWSVQYVSRITTKNPQAIIHEHHIIDYILYNEGLISDDEFKPHPDWTPIGTKIEIKGL